MDGHRSDPDRITQLLEGSTGLSRREILERLLPIVYDELRALAAAQLRRERPDHTLQPTALVNEVYIRLLASGGGVWNDKSHFFRVAARAMRRILVEHARKRSRLKRGGRTKRVSLDQVEPEKWDDPERLLALDEALRRLEEQDPRSAEVVQLRYFCGLSVAQTADALGLSERTVKREWTFARAWLRQALQ